jgi:glycolate oxidase FAD binding subunit
MSHEPLLAELIARVQAAQAQQTPLILQGGQSKRFYPAIRAERGETLDLSGYRGVINYAPGELVMTARAGTPLADIEALLDAHGQMLGFEPPHYGPGATLGGTLACGFSGPRRPYAGAARDFILGIEIIDGRGQLLNFGGQVMKNVAGYDVSRLMVGALGTLGILTRASLKVLPRPASELTLRFELNEARAIGTMNQWAGQPLPISASAWVGDALMLRLSGAASAVQAAHQQLGGELHPQGADFWRQAREQQSAFFTHGDLPLWRLVVPGHAAPLGLPGRTALTWGGSQRWLRSDAPASRIRDAVNRVGGHATLFRSTRADTTVLAPLPPALARLHQRLKQAFDPAGILNPGCLFSETA